MSNFLETIRRLGTTRLIVMGSVAAALLVGFAVLATRLSAPTMGLLFGELTVEDSSRIVEKLEGMGVPYELGGNGTRIYVPEEQALRLRMTMASEGLPTGGSIGYELFDRSNGLGTTDFVQKINHLRALEGELARTIRAIDRVDAARVHLVLPRRELFARDRPEPSASIVLKVRGRALGPGQVEAIQNLVAAAVRDLKPGRVSIVDDSGRLLSRSVEDETGRSHASLTEFRLTYENHLKEAIERLVQRSVGIGNIRAEVSAEVDFDRFTQNSETFDPDSQVVRSTQLVEESSSTNETDAEDTVTVANNLPEAAAADESSPGMSSRSMRTEETINYEISKTTRTQIHEAGTVKRVSVAVLVDGTYETNAQGEETYQPRSPEELEKIAALVRSAIGFDSERGDQVEVINMRFTRLAEETFDEVEETGFSLTKADYLRIAEIAAFIVVGLLTLLLVVRPLLARLPASPAAAPEAPPQLPAPPRPIQNPDILQAIESGSISQQEAERLLAAKPESNVGEADQLIDIAMIEGRVKSSSLKKIGELIDGHPEEAVGIMRSWIYQDNRA